MPSLYGVGHRQPDGLVYLAMARVSGRHPTRELRAGVPHVQAVRYSETAALASVVVCAGFLACARPIGNCACRACFRPQALARVHALGVLHGDVREENILLDVKDVGDAQKQCQVRGLGILPMRLCLAVSCDCCCSAGRAAGKMGRV